MHKETMRSVWIFPEFRAGHVPLVEQFNRLTIYALNIKWDLFSDEVPERVSLVSVREACRALWQEPARTVELAEPLFLRQLPNSLLLAAVAKVSAWRRGSSVRICAYAIENNQALHVLGLPHHLRWAGRLGLKVVFLAVRRLYDDIIFGSDGSRDVYTAWSPWFSQFPVVAQLPAAHGQLQQVESDPQGVVYFVGELSERKGLPQLMQAWEVVEGVVPTATLAILGQGPLEEHVRRWVCGSSRRTFLGMVPQESVIELLFENAEIVVAPSRRDGRWREQIGRPIMEGLSVGASIVTTDETGLASWLKANGHRVITGNATANELASAVVDMLKEHPTRADVLRTLPARDGRAVAATMMHP